MPIYKTVYSDPNEIDHDVEIEWGLDDDGVELENVFTQGVEIKLEDIPEDTQIDWVIEIEEKLGDEKANHADYLYDCWKDRER